MTEEVIGTIISMEEVMGAVTGEVFGVWFLIGAALVFWMQAGFAMVEAGFTRAKNTGNIIMKNLMDFCIGTVVFILIGFSLHRFICASYTNGVFDKLINSKIEGVQVGRGLYVEEEDDGEDKSEEDAAEDSAALPDDASVPSSENKAESAND